FCAVSPAIIRLLRAKWVLVIAWACHSLYTFSNFYPTYPTLVTSSLLLGVVAGPMWTAQGLYISASGITYAQDKQIELHAALSRLNGIFFAAYESTQVTGNLIASIVFMRDTYNETILHSPDRICGADSCPGGLNQTHHIEQPEKRIVYTLLGIFLACNLVALILSIVAMPHLPRCQEASTEAVTKSLTSCLTMVLEPRMLLLLPFFMAQAMNSGILTSKYTDSFVSCSVGVQWVGYVMAAFGGLTAVLAVTLNYAAKYISRRILFPAAAVADMAWVFAMVLWDPKGESVGMFFILPVVSGFAEAIFQAQFYSLVAIVFSKQMSGAFAIYHGSKAAAFTLTFVLARFLCLRDLLYVALGLSLVGLAGYVTVEIWLAHDRKKAEKQVLPDPVQNNGDVTHHEKGATYSGKDVAWVKDSTDF
ncbi:hypothetical protein BaRGS_00002019, partial [Batillaria attramentaria]